DVRCVRVCEVRWACGGVWCCGGVWWWGWVCVGGVCVWGVCGVCVFVCVCLCVCVCVCVGVVCAAREGAPLALPAATMRAYARPPSASICPDAEGRLPRCCQDDWMTGRPPAGIRQG